jgi:hypothetical protein
MYSAGKQFGIPSNEKPVTITGFDLYRIAAKGKILGVAAI